MPLPTEEELRRMQRAMTDYFHFWRRGHAHRWDRWERQAHFEKMPFPRKGKWPGFDKSEDRDKTFRKPRKIAQIWDAAGPGYTKFRASQVTKTMESRMEVAEFKFVKILGWGGLGVASLWEAVSPMGRKRRVVCKMDLFDHNPCAEDEIQMHLRTAGAKHVIQRVVLQDQRNSKQLPSGRSSRQRSSRHTGKQPSGQAGPASSRAAKNGEEFLELDKDEIANDMKTILTEELDADKRVLFIEYMPRGRFDDYLGRIAVTGKRFPDQVLWQIFDCWK